MEVMTFSSCSSENVTVLVETPSVLDTGQWTRCGLTHLQGGLDGSGFPESLSSPPHQRKGPRLWHWPGWFILTLNSHGIYGVFNLILSAAKHP